MRRVVAVEIREECDWHEWSRWLGTFYLQFDEGSGVPDLEDDGTPPFTPDTSDLDDLRFWDDAAGDWDWEALQARESEIYAEAETEAQADPHRRLHIDEAVALAQKFADRVTVWLDHEAWDASRVPRHGQRVWPPAGLHLRPRWHYESPTAPAAPAWLVQFTLEARGLTEGVALEIARRAPLVLDAQPIEEEGPTSSSGRVTVACLVAASDEVAANNCHALVDELIAQFPVGDGEIGVGASLPEPADPANWPAAARRLPPR